MRPAGINRLIYRLYAEPKSRPPMSFIDLKSFARKELRSIKSRCKMIGRLCTISEEDIIYTWVRQPGKDAYTGKPMDVRTTRGSRKPFANGKSITGNTLVYSGKSCELGITIYNSRATTPHSYRNTSGWFVTIIPTVRPQNRLGLLRLFRL